MFVPNNQTGIPDHCLRNHSLGLKDRGMLATLILLSHYDRKDISVSMLDAFLNNGKTKTYNALNRLISFDYVEANQIKKADGKFGPVQYTLSESVANSRKRAFFSSEILRDKEAGLEARGLLATMAFYSRIPTWNFCIKGLASVLPDGEETIRNAMRVLEDKGYVYVERKKDITGRFRCTDYHLTEKGIGGKKKGKK